MKRKLKKYAMLYLYDLMDEMYPDENDMTLENFIDNYEIKITYREEKNVSRIDAIMEIYMYGELEAKFLSNIAC